MSESKATLLAALKDLVDEDTAWTILIKPDPVPSLIVREPDSGFELHLGNQEHADSFGLLGERKIGAVVSVCADEEECAARTSMYAPAIRFHGFHIKDDEEFDLLGALDAIFLALDALRADGRPTILHCRAGMSRSPTIVAAYLMHAYDLHMLDAFRIVKEARPRVLPNEGFIHQLVEFHLRREAARTPSKGPRPRLLVSRDGAPPHPFEASEEARLAGEETPSRGAEGDRGEEGAAEGGSSGGGGGGGGGGR